MTTKRKATPKQLEALKKARAKRIENLKAKGLRGLEVGLFGKVYKQFKDKPKQAIKHLKKVKQGACTKALYRDDIGYIDIVWGENNPKTNKGYGLKHIIEKHEKEIKQLGFEVEDFIPIVVQYGSINIKKSETHKKVYESKNFRFVIALDKKNQKQWLLTAFDLRKKPNYKKHRRL